jgi:hypothetical protein
MNYIRGLLLIELIAFGETGCFSTTDTTELLEYYARLLDLYTARAAESLGTRCCDAGVLTISFSWFLVMNSALDNLFCFLAAKVSSARNRILSVRKPTIPKKPGLSLLLL